LKELERENRELKRANEILKQAICAVEQIAPSTYRCPGDRRACLASRRLHQHERSGQHDDADSEQAGARVKRSSTSRSTYVAPPYGHVQLDHVN
jgi:hypothetical protein